MRFLTVMGITYYNSMINQFNLVKQGTLKQEDIDRIERYVNGEANAKEGEYVESLFINGENNLYLLNRINKDWDMMLRDAEQKDVNTSHILDRIHHIILKEETNKNKRPLRRLLRVYMKAAAILLIPLLFAGSLFYHYVSNIYLKNTGEEAITNIYAPYGSRASFTLPDGTTGILNSGSTLAYRLPFSHKRNVKLEGEAWFEVKSDEDNPFTINTGNSVVKVLGTSFNISAYPMESYVEIVLAEGEVEFLDNISGQREIINPSERLIKKGGRINKGYVELEKYISWTEGKLTFRSDPMDEVARRIERWYNVKVIIADKELLKYSFRATFEDDRLEDVLRYLTMTSPISYRITPRTMLPDGSFKKEEITFYKIR